MWKWLAGILATVISGVVVYQLTTPTPAPSAIDIAGFVVDAESNALITNALVRLEVQGHSNAQRTDTEGRFYFDVEGDNSNYAATLEVEATGYEKYSINSSLQSLSNQIPKLTRVPGARGGAAVHPAKLPLPTYTRRMDAAKIVFHR
jgi:hypothetical protein